MIWLSTSIFSSKQNWNSILRNGISSFVKNQLLIQAHVIQFNCLSGENIRLALLTEEWHATAVANAARHYFNQYFIDAQLSTLPVRLPVDGIFMPFPANSIQFGLYPPEHIDANELHHYKASIALSEIMLTALADEIDDDTILTFAFYLQVALIKVIHQHLNDMELLYSILSTRPGLSKANCIDGTVKANQDLMTEIIRDIMNSEEFSADLCWLNTWASSFKALIQVTNVNSISLVKETLQTYIYTIYKRLNITDEIRLILLHLISNSLEQYFNKILN